MTRSSDEGTAQHDERLVLLGSFLKSQRQLANLSLRQLSLLTDVSNPYLSQLERGLHEPSVRVLKSIAEALNVSTETIMAQAGLLTTEGRQEAPSTEAAIRTDSRLTEAQKRAMLSVYRSYIEGNNEDGIEDSESPASA